MCMTVHRARSLAVSATFALAIFMASTALHAAETSEAFIVPLFPQKEADLKKGLPPGMTAYSFWAGCRFRLSPRSQLRSSHLLRFRPAPPSRLTWRRSSKAVRYSRPLPEWVAKPVTDRSRKEKSVRATAA